jgi:sterol desaturase/sphingolipid hydroxylase (fatty acid hydroxylase superfamily)
LWRFHRVHHSTESLDATAGLRMHAVDFLQLTAVPVVLFGLLLDVSHFASWVLPAAVSVGIVADTFSHMHVEFPHRNPVCRALLYVFNNPLFHSWHHTRDGVLCDGNYANAFPVWDVLFGSNVTRPEPPALYGIDGDQRLDHSLLGLQLLRPRRD